MSDLTTTSGLRPVQTPGEIQADENTPENRVDLKNKTEDANTAELNAKQFEDLLNGQQKITELQTNQPSAVFDPAQDIADNTVFQQPGQARPL